MSEAEVITERFYTKREAATVLRCSEITVHRLIKSHQLGHFRIASKVFVGGQHLKDYLASAESKPKEAA